MWFVRSDGEPLAFFDGIWRRWTSVRKLADGEARDDLFGFLTTEANREVGAIYPKAMPVYSDATRRTGCVDEDAGRRGAAITTAFTGWLACVDPPTTFGMTVKGGKQNVRNGIEGAEQRT